MRNVETIEGNIPTGHAGVKLWHWMCKQLAGLMGWHHHHGARMTLKECEEELPRIREEMEAMRGRLDDLERGQNRDDTGAPANG